MNKNTFTIKLSIGKTCIIIIGYDVKMFMIIFRFKIICTVRHALRPVNIKVLLLHALRRTVVIKYMSLYSSRKLQVTSVGIVHKFESHMLKGLFTEWHEIFTLSKTPDFNPFGEFMISPVYYIYIYMYITDFVSLLTVFGD